MTNTPLMARTSQMASLEASKVWCESAPLPFCTCSLVFVQTFVTCLCLALAPSNFGWCLVLQADEMKVQAHDKVMRFSANNGGGEGSASRKRKQSNSERAESPLKEKAQAKTPKFIPSDSDSDDNSEFAASLFASRSISVSVCL